MRMFLLALTSMLTLTGAFLTEGRLLGQVARKHHQEIGTLGFPAARGAGCALWGNPVLGVFFGLRAQKSRYVVGEPVTLTTCLYNSGDAADLSLTYADVFDRYELLAIEADGHPESPTEDSPRNKHHGLRSKRFRDFIAPGERRVEAIDARDFLDLSAPGTYDVIAQRGAFFSHHGSLISNAVRVEIVAP